MWVFNSLVILGIGVVIWKNLSVISICLDKQMKPQNLKILEENSWAAEAVPVEFQLGKRCAVPCALQCATQVTFSPTPPAPFSLRAVSLISVSMSLFLFCLLFCLLDSTYKWNHIIFIFL